MHSVTYVINKDNTSGWKLSTTSKDKALIPSSEDISIVRETRRLLYPESQNDWEIAKAAKLIRVDGRKRMIMYGDMLRLAGALKMLPGEYLEYRMHTRRRIDQNQFVSHAKLINYWDKFNSVKATRFNDKEHANKVIRSRLGSDHAATTIAVIADGEFTKETLVAALPCFIKPVFGVQGIDAYTLIQYDKETDTFKTSKGDIHWEDLKYRLSFSAYTLDKIIESSFKPYFAEKSGALNTFRFVALRGEIIGAAFKVSSPTASVDNFSHEGNYAIGVDLDSGNLLHTMYRGKDYIGEHDLDIGHTVVPEWQSLMDFMSKAVKALTEIKFVGIDVALTDKGPVIIDINHTPGLRLMQIPYQKGFKSLLK